MEDHTSVHAELRQQALAALEQLSTAEREARTRAIEARLFDFANFLEARIVMMYLPGPGEVDTRDMIRRALDYNKIVVLPEFSQQRKEVRLLKIDNLEADLCSDASGLAGPDPQRCRQVPLDVVDIAILPAVALDEKGGRIGRGDRSFDRLIPLLAVTTRKVALGFEEQILPQIPMESHDKFVDIIITNQRTIYKI
jgi:5-formyltetrahydrofolate cyclo-ligase